MNYILRLSLCGVFVTSVVFAAGVSSWPEWRGTTGTGTAPGAQPPTTWSDTQNIRWKTKIPGEGFSTPIIWKDQVFLLAAIETNEGGAPSAAAEKADNTPPAPPPGGKRPGGKKGPGGGGRGGFGGGPTPTKVYEFAVLSLDRKSGKILWQKTARREVPHEGHQPNNTFASQSPITDGERLYVLYGSRGLYCYDFQGNEQWTKDLGRMSTKMGFGEGASPALAGDLLIVPWDHEGGSFIAAFNKKTGAEVWRTPREEKTSWSTPLIVNVDGKLQAILPASRRTRSYDVATGKVVWEAGGLTSNVIAMPVTGNGLVYVMSGFQGFSIQAIKLTAQGDVSESDNIVWHIPKSGPYVASPALSGDRLFVVKDRYAILSCFNAKSGEANYQDRPLEGLREIYASPLVANGHVYVVGREGTALVLKDAAKFEVVATNKLSDRIDASPVAVDRELFLRGHEYLFCIAEG